MDTLQFFKTVLPSEGVAFLSFKRGGLKGRQNNTDRNASLEVLARRALSLDERGFDTWQGMCSYRADGDLNEYGNLARSAANALYARSAWQDWDADPDDPRKHATIEEAGAGALAFYQHLLPPGTLPLVVRSGGGLHTYVVFDRNVPAADWVEIAEMVKALGRHWGARFDPTRAADLASLMRPVGTHNHKKSEPRLVRALNDGRHTVMDWTVYAARVRELFTAAGIPLTEVRAHLGGPALGDVPLEVLGAEAAPITLAPTEFTPADFRRVLQRCQQMAWIDANQPLVPEPLWRAALSVAGRCEDGGHAIHWISEKHPSYDADETQAKFDGTPAPFRCTEFESHRAGGCDGCPYKGTIRSPITLGESVVADAPIKRNVQVVEHAVSSATVDPDDIPTFTLKVQDIPTLDVAGYKYSKGRIVHATKIKVKGDDGKEVTKEFDEVILDHPFYPTNVYVDTRDAAAPVWSSEWYAKPPGAPAKHVLLSAVDMASKDAMTKWLGKTIGFIPPFEQQVVKLISAMKHWLQGIRAEATREIPPTLGWFRTGPDAENKETVFVLGNKMLTANGVVPINTASHLGNADAFEAEGTLEAWLDVYRLYSRPGFENHGVATLVGFAGPMVEMTPLSSVVVNLTGKSGGGKSTLQSFVSTIYGSSRALVKSPVDTPLSHLKFLRDMQNLPVMFDDFHKVQPADLVDRVFTWANGWNTGALNRSGGVNKERGGIWRTSIMPSTNLDLHDAIKNYFTGDKRAARMRVLQIRIPDVQWGEDLSTWTNHTLIHNYGHAGLRWLDYLRMNRNKITKQLGETQLWIEKNWGAQTAERFFTQGCAMLLVALYHTRKIGICPLDEGRTIEAIRELFESSKRGAHEVTISPESTLSDYINAHLKDMITTVAGMPDSSTDRLISGDERHLVVGRFVKSHSGDAGELWLLTDPLREWCKHRKISCEILQRELHASGITSSVETTVNLGWKLPAFNSPRAKGIKVDMEKLL